MQTTFTNKIVMIRPHKFGMNEQTAESNSFQSKLSYENANEISKKAVKEFDEMVVILRDKGIEIQVFEDSNYPIKPDAVFSNNWVSTRPDGNVILYPMLAENRRVEYRQDIVKWLSPKGQVVDLRGLVSKNQFLEGTGSVIFDQEAKIIYACISARTTPDAVQLLADKLNFTVCSFHATDHQNVPIYHTNVLMFVMNNLVAISLETIRDEEERNQVVSVIEASGKKVLPLDYYQITQFSGNMIQLLNDSGEPILVASKLAWEALNADQKQEIEKNTDVVTVDITTIELYGGGSARCMITENFVHE